MAANGGENSVVELKDKAQLAGLLNDKKPCILHFWTSWSEPCKQINETLVELSKELLDCQIVKVEAENLAEISLEYEIVAVPTVIFIKDGKVFDRIDGAHVPDIVKKARSLNQNIAGIIPPSVSLPKKDLNTRLKELIVSSPCVLFMKGNREEPRCGFSRQMVSLLQEEKIEFSTFDILKDEEVRQGLKKYSNWPTYPQLYMNGELIGGLDIVKELKETGELKSTIESAGES